jgi:hypothetical protein
MHVVGFSLDAVKAGGSSSMSFIKNRIARLLWRGAKYEKIYSLCA